MPLLEKYLVSLLFAGAVIINIITCLVVWHLVHGAAGTLPIHYNVVSGFDQLGSSSALYGLASFGVIILIMNVVLVYFLGGLGRFIKLICASSSLFVSIVLLLAVLLLKMQVS